MRFRCDVVKDLMPLCLDHEATKDSEQLVIEHLAECEKCAAYYEELGKETVPTEEKKEFENKYVALATRMRKRKNVRTAMGVFVGLLVGGIVFLCMNYASGYRFNPKAAADISGRLNDSSQFIGSYEWKDDRHFYFYESLACYDVVSVDRSWHGWKQYDIWLNWPKWSLYDEIEGENGVDVAGAMCHYRYDEGIQLFPIIVHDERVKTVEVTCYEKTEKKEVSPEEFILFTFDAVSGKSNAVEGKAYDADGKVIYRLDDQPGRWLWVPVEE